MTGRDPDVIVVGAGLACAKYLNHHHVSVRIIEASDALVGRVRTDKVDGFLLDRGFQVLRGNASIEGALISGRRAAEAIIRDIH